jgi:hypothetical protein
MKNVIVYNSLYIPNIKVFIKSYLLIVVCSLISYIYIPNIKIYIKLLLLSNA